MENKIKIFFEDDEDNFEKSFEKHSQEMRARMDSAFGSSLASTGRDESLFDAAQNSSTSLFGRDSFREADDFFSNSRSLFNSNERGRSSPSSIIMPLTTLESRKIEFPTCVSSCADLNWTDETHWEKVIPLNTEHSYSNVGIKCKNNMLEIGASEEVVQMNNGQKSMSKSHFKNSFSIPAGTIKNKIHAETIGSKIIVRGEIEKKSKMEEEKATEIPIKFE
ncbi:unnamed protein product [Oikopleura dioica]|uniref:SHSP domain-containing protein n=1 Tax=Oikopleura dioica TaxID=34765 RepID=E4WVI1_OIKDI|nr:unnamed protein product [Oikopleura dioica]